jgi:hypothetical protein
LDLSVVTTFLDYPTFPGFEHIYLEDSYVLDVENDTQYCEIKMDFVLTEGHPLYQKPGSEEAHCFRRGVIRFERLKNAKWIGRTETAARDATGEIDFGCLEEFFFDGEKYILFGEIGRLEIWADPPIVSYSE